MNILSSSEFSLHTRIGNKLFNLCFLLGCEKKYNRELILPSYFLFDSLENPPKIDNNIKGEVTFAFRHDGFDPNYVDEFFLENREKSIDLQLNPYCQTNRWWEHCEDYVNSKLKFKKSEIEKVSNKYKHLLNKTTIGISIRLGTDFTNDNGFFKIPKEWYISALNTQFPTWREQNVVIFSDNIELAKSIFSEYSFLYPEPNNSYILKYDSNNYHTPKAIEQLVLASLMDNFICSNSTFSWWCGYYSRMNNNGKIVNCGKNLANTYLERTKNNYDYYPKEWILHPIN